MAILSVTSTQIINEEESASMLQNDVINNLHFKFHTPAYNFLGPGNKLNKRITRRNV